MSTEDEIYAYYSALSKELEANASDPSYYNNDAPDPDVDGMDLDVSDDRQLDLFTMSQEHYLWDDPDSFVMSTSTTSLQSPSTIAAQPQSGAEQM